MLDYRIGYSTLADCPRVTYDNEVKETKSINIIKELYKNENGTREKIDLYDANGDPIIRTILIWTGFLNSVSS